MCVGDDRLFAEVVQGADHIQPGGDGFFGVVIAGERRAPNGHHAIAQVFVNVPVMRLDDFVQPFRNVFDHIADGFEVQLFSQGCEALYVSK